MWLRPWVLTGNTDFQGPFSSPDCKAEGDIGPKWRIQDASYFFALAANWFKLTDNRWADVGPGFFRRLLCK